MGESYLFDAIQSASKLLATHDWTSKIHIIELESLRIGCVSVPFLVQWKQNC